jgi:hypothetical protein
MLVGQRHALPCTPAVWKELPRLFLFHLNGMRLGPRVVAHAGHLPGGFHTRVASRDSELSILDYSGDIDSSIPSNRGELIAEIRIESFEPFGHGDNGFPLAIEHHIAAIDVDHLRGFDRGVIERFVFLVALPSADVRFASSSRTVSPLTTVC